MGEIIKLNAPRATLAKPPADRWKLRWRLQTRNGVAITSSWTPESRYPSVVETLKEFAGRIDGVFIEGVNRTTGERATFLHCPGDMFLNLSYKGMLSANTGRSICAGIEVEDQEGDKYLVLRDGTVYVEERKAVNVANHD